MPSRQLPNLTKKQLFIQVQQMFVSRGGCARQNGSAVLAKDRWGGDKKEGGEPDLRHLR